MEILAERLKELREEKRLSQNELAKAVGLGQSSIAHWEKPDRIPNAEAVAILAKYFQVSADYLLGLSND